ncbi:6106_t:CDS:2 [Funneliformis geosporum]|uniref:15013_t:CDS:1 n=1 Tax=Funneliformis geosporum TaxID=1117311 RepID=A0A9W4SQN7_9GLOM|nr:6106_t:CDS:2 [Funneliformis geosporum]CAI2178067.1 15013_t:CDS:2 [Funneliformis geosporum]
MDNNNNQQFNPGQYYHQESPIFNNRESSTNQYIVTSEPYNAEPIYHQQQPQQVIDMQRRLPPIPSEYLTASTTPFSGVDHNIPPEERKFTGVTSLEQLWRMEFFYQGKPTLKFWFALFWLLYFTFIVIVLIVGIMQGVGNSGSKFGGDNHCLNLVPNCKPGEFQCGNGKSATGCPEIYCSKIETDDICYPTSSSK